MKDKVMFALYILLDALIDSGQPEMDGELEYKGKKYKLVLKEVE